MPETDPLGEADRIMQICNACRYCEAYCAVFPAMARRLTFAEGDLNYLANLCHGCGSCYYACQYAPPHEFAVHVPKTLAELRKVTYQKYAWPRVFARAFERNGLVVSIVTAICLAGFILGVFWAGGGLAIDGGRARGASFYSVVPHAAMITIFGAAGLYVVAVWTIGFIRFWRDTGEKLGQPAMQGALWSAIKDALTLRYLGGGGEGCTYPGEQPATSRRLFHHATFYGFMLCFASTTAGAIFHYAFGWSAPYSPLSLPVILGSLGGIGLLIGPAGLIWLRHGSDPELVDHRKDGMDAGLLMLLLLTSLSGLLLLASRATPAMPPLLAIHLGIVLALFLMMPYGKFVHGIYRLGALIRYALERSRPDPHPSFEG